MVVIGIKGNRKGARRRAVVESEIALSKVDAAYQQSRGVLDRTRDETHRTRVAALEADPDYQAACKVADLASEAARQARQEADCVGEVVLAADPDHQAACETYAQAVEAHQTTVMVDVGVAYRARHQAREAAGLSDSSTPEVEFTRMGW